MTAPTLFDDLDFAPAINRFHNTTEIQGEELKKRQIRNGSQNKKVLSFFQSHSYENYTPFEIWKVMGINNQPKSSIQRAMTDLTTMGYLNKLDGKEGRPFVQRPGEWKENCFCWILK